MALRSPSRDTFHLLTVVVAVVVVCSLYFAKVVFVPLALAMLMAFVLTPVVKFFEAARLGRTFSTCVVVVLALGSVGAIGWMVARQFSEVLNQLPEYQSNLREKVHSLTLSGNSTFNNASRTMDNLSEALSSSPDAGSDFAAQKRAGSNAARSRQPVRVEVVKPAALPLETAQGVIGLGLQGLIVIVFTVFMLMRRENLRNRLISVAGQQRLSVMTHALDEASDRVSRYLRTQLIINTLYGAIIGVGLHLIGIPGGLLWGVVVGILRFMPYVGPPLGGIMPVLLSLAISPGWRMPLITLGLFVVTELTITYAVEPMLYGAHTGVSPLAILVSAIFWTVLWGPVGLVLAMPLTVCLVVVGRHVPHLGFLPLLMGDDPVLTEDVRVYQRLLARDQEEAEQLLEDLLEEKPLVEVYDSVLIPALNLAEQDRHRDLLDEDSEKFIFRSAREIVDDLYEISKGSRSSGPPSTPVSPIEAPSERSAAGGNSRSVMCVPARDEADEIIATMLAQSLERSGYPCHSVRAGTIDETIQEVGSRKPDIVCISGLPPFVISHTRSLYRALKAHSPDLQIVVGLWGFSGDTTNVARRIGTEPVTTLAEVVRFVGNPHLGTEKLALTVDKG